MGAIAPLIACCIRNGQPNIKAKGAGIVLLLYGLIIIGVGVLLYSESGKVIEVAVRYDDKPLQKDLSINVEITEKMDKPVYVFLNFVDFYQNHRAMVGSLSRKQLEDIYEDPKKLAERCSGALTNAEMGVTISITSKPLVSTDIASPCGFLAKNFPTDDYKTMRKIDTGTFYQIVVSDLTPREEVDKYSIKNIDSSWIRVNQTRFINWMKTSATSNFYKLWGRIDSDLDKGMYSFTLDNMVDVSKTFKGQKNAVFSTGSKFGGKKSMPALVAIFLGLLLLAAGVFNLYTWLNPAKAAQEAPLVIDDGY